MADLNRPLCSFALLVLASAASAQAITVTTFEDVTDFPAPQMVGQLPGPDGRVSFREALEAANNTAGPQTIGFAIPTSEWWLVGEQALLKQEHGIFPLEDDATTVDFTTQTAFTGDTNPNGGEVGIYGLEPNAWGVASIYVFGDGCVIEGLDRVLQRGYAVEVWGSHNRIIGCTISGPLYAAVYLTGPFSGAPSVGNVVGGTALGEGNVLSSGNDGVRIDAPSEDNVVIGNVLTGSWHGVAVRGSQFTTTAKRNRIGGPTPAERNVISNAGHYGEEGFPVGAQVALQWAEDTLVEGNFIGTTPDGLASAVQVGPTGIEVGENATGTIVRGNLISGLVVAGVNHYQGQVFGEAIELLGPGANDTLIVDNRIGTDVTGEGAIPNHRGVVAQPLFLGGAPTLGTRLGGTAPGAANTIAFNDLQGVLVSPFFTSVRISGNSIHDNGTLGIDLAPVGPTPNDPGDGDGGANGLQNFPVLTGAAATEGGTAVSGELDSLPSQAFSIEIFGSPACDPSGFGEGREFLGAVSVTTDAAGHADFVAVVSPDEPGAVYTATATQLATGNTSEFSACLEGGPWTSLGLGKPGSTGTPLLAGSGPLTGGSSNQLELTGACPSCLAMLVAGPSELGAPFHGGVLVPYPLVLLPRQASPAGAVSLPFTWPVVPPGVTVYLQYWISDPAASFGASASNGLAGVSQ